VFTCRVIHSLPLLMSAIQWPITTNIMSSHPAHGDVYLIQHYVIKFVSDLRQVSGFLWVLCLIHQ
jgi:hypothetical protein